MTDVDRRVAFILRIQAKAPCQAAYERTALPVGHPLYLPPRRRR